MEKKNDERSFHSNACCTEDTLLLIIDKYLSQVKAVQSQVVMAVLFQVILATLIIIPYATNLVIDSAFLLIPGQYQGPDIRFDYVKGVCWAMSLGLSITMWPIRTEEKMALQVIWFIKSLVTLWLMLFFDIKYGFDGDGYWVNGASHDYVPSGIQIGDGTTFIWYLTWLLNKVSHGSYHASRVTFSFLGFLGIYLLFRGITLHLRQEKLRLFYVMSLLPSILFWSSGLGKDPVTLFGISLVFYGMISWMDRKRLASLIWCGAGIMILAFVRLWLVPIFLLPMLLVVFVASRKIIIRTAILITSLLLVSSSVNHWNIQSTEDLLGLRDYATLAFEGGESSRNAPEFNRVSDALVAVPRAIGVALFRPFPWEMPSFFGKMAGLENLALLTLSVALIFKVRRDDLKDPVVISVSLIIFVWGTFYGLTTYNYGTIARYKLQILPLLIGLYFLLMRDRSQNQSFLKER